MAATPPTVVSLKQSFLTTQTRLLSQPLTPTRAWRTSNSDDPSVALPEKAIDDALFKLNHHLQQHARRVYAPQATRHVAEQIDQLYWNAAEAATQGDRGYLDGDEDGDGEGLGVSLSADLADPTVIATLPSEWDHPEPSSSSSSSSHPLEAKRYAELAADLRALAERKQQAAARVARLRRMRTLLEPFGPDPAAAASSSPAGGGGGGAGLDGVQENLVTRNGDVEAELHRMRMLLARVGGRVGQLKEQGGPRRGGGDGGGEDVDMDEQRKVGLLLDSF